MYFFNCILQTFGPPSLSAIFVPKYLPFKKKKKEVNTTANQSGLLGL